METNNELTTPCFIVNLDKVRNNCSKMANYAQSQKVQLVPHMKTHKTREIGKLMIEHQQDRTHVIVSTLAEARFYAQLKDPLIDEITYAYHLTPDKIAKCNTLSTKVDQLNLLIENDVILNHLSSTEPFSARRVWNVYVEIDLLYGRTGLNAKKEETIDFIKRVSNTPNINFIGLYMHCGSSYHSASTKETENVIRESVSGLNYVRERLQQIGVECPRVSIGSTPSCGIFSENVFDGITEIHPGNYVFYDAQDFSLGSCRLEDIACTVLTRVIGHYPEQNMIAIDCGWTALSLDSATKESHYFKNYGYARVRDHPSLKLVSMSQEIGKVTTNDNSQLDFSRLPIGCQLELYPFHSCATAAMHGSYLIYEGSQFENKVKDVYQPCRGW